MTIIDSRPKTKDSRVMSEQSRCPVILASSSPRRRGIGFVFRIAYCVLRIALGELGLIGFELGLFSPRLQRRSFS